MRLAFTVAVARDERCRIRLDRGRLLSAPFQRGVNTHKTLSSVADLYQTIRYLPNDASVIFQSPAIVSCGGGQSLRSKARAILVPLPAHPCSFCRTSFIHTKITCRARSSSPHPQCAPRLAHNEHPFQTFPLWYRMLQTPTQLFPFFSIISATYHVQCGLTGNTAPTSQ